MSIYYETILKENKVNKLFARVFDDFYKLKKDLLILDIGGMPGIDARYAITNSGVKVDILDTYKDPRKYMAATENVNYINQDILLYSIPENKYDIINAHFIFSLFSKSVIGELFLNICSALKEGGVICFTIHGDRDTWKLAKPDNAIYSKIELENLCKKYFTDFDMVEVELNIDEVEGNKHNWHYFEVICKK